MKKKKTIKLQNYKLRMDRTELSTLLWLAKDGCSSELFKLFMSVADVKLMSEIVEEIRLLICAFNHLTLRYSLCRRLDLAYHIIVETIQDTVKNFIILTVITINVIPKNPIGRNFILSIS